MQIKRTSWHYKFNNLFTDNESVQDNLCKYFWRLVGAVIALAISVLSLGLAIYLLGYSIYSYFASSFLISNTIIVAFIFSSIVLPIVAIKLIRKKVGGPAYLPTENILIEYIKAKKSKVCPVIKYID